MASVATNAARSIGPIVAVAGVTVTFVASVPATRTCTARGVMLQFVTRILMVAAPPGQTWLTRSPSGFGIQHGGGMSQPQVFGRTLGRIGVCWIEDASCP